MRVSGFELGFGIVVLLGLMTTVGLGVFLGVYFGTKKANRGSHGESVDG